MNSLPVPLSNLLRRVTVDDTAAYFLLRKGVNQSEARGSVSDL